MMRTLVRLSAWSLLLALAIMTIGPLSHRPGTLLPAHLERLIAWACAGILFAMAYPDRPFFVVGLLVGAAGLFELAQLESLHRHGRPADFLVKAAGSLVGVGSVLAVQFCRGEVARSGRSRAR